MNDRSFSVFIALVLVMSIGVAGYIVREDRIAEDNYIPVVITGTVTKTYSETKYEGSPRYFIVIDRRQSLQVKKSTFITLMEGDNVTCTKYNIRGYWNVKVD